MPGMKLVVRDGDPIPQSWFNDNDNHDHKGDGTNKSKNKIDLQNEVDGVLWREMYDWFCPNGSMYGYGVYGQPIMVGSLPAIVINRGMCASGWGGGVLNITKSWISTFTTSHSDHETITLKPCNWAGGESGGMARGLGYTNNTWYHLFVMAMPDKSVAFGFDTNINGSNLIICSKCIMHRRIHSLFFKNLFDGFAPFYQNGDYYEFTTPIPTTISVRMITPGIDFVLLDAALYTPMDVVGLEATVSIQSFVAGNTPTETADNRLLLSSFNTAPYNPLGLYQYSSKNDRPSCMIRVMATNKSYAALRYQSVGNSNGVATVTLLTHGYYDRRLN